MVQTIYKVLIIKENLNNKRIDKRGLHQRLLQKNIYIPLEDLADNHDLDQYFNLKKSATEGTIYAWIPIRIKLPLFGEKVVEWQTKFP